MLFCVYSHGRVLGLKLDSPLGRSPLSLFYVGFFSTKKSTKQLIPTLRSADASRLITTNTSGGTRIRCIDWLDIMKIPKTKEELEALIEKEVHRALTIQALNMRNEIYGFAVMDVSEFETTYLGGIGLYEKRIAAEEGISI